MLQSSSQFPPSPPPWPAGVLLRMGRWKGAEMSPLQTLRAVPGLRLHGWGPRGEEDLMGRAPPACGLPAATRARQPRALQPCEAGTTSPLGGSPTVALPLPSLQETFLRVSICEAVVLRQALGQTTVSELIHEHNSS